MTSAPSSPSANAATGKGMTIGQKRSFSASLKITMIDGLTFLLPLLVIGWLLQKFNQAVTKVAQPAMAMLPDSLVGGTLVSVVETGLLLVVIIYLCGLLAGTAMAQRLMQFVQNSAIGTLPQFSFVRGITESLGDSDENLVQVVLVRGGTGWSLGVTLEPSDAPVVAVYLFGAPQWTSGSVVFTERSAIVPAGINFAKAIRIQKRLGADSADVVRLLTASNSTVVGRVLPHNAAQQGL